MEELEKWQIEILKEIEAASDLKNLEELRLKALGKQGYISNLMKTLGTLEGEERRQKGILFNQLRDAVSAALSYRNQALADQDLMRQIEKDKIDVSLPERSFFKGSIHPLSQALFETIEIFQDMGFGVAEGPDIEDDFHNFTALNIPEEHPARQEQDTFYLPKNRDGKTMVLRTHTSPVQIRTMKEKKPPLRIIVPGRVYRSDFDQTHTPTFHQIEGLYVDKGVTMGHLKGCLIEFCQRFFGVDDLPVRFRPSYFPFTEPSAEVDIGCSREKDGLKIGPGKDWLEILGCGMVHPQVLENCGIDPNEYQGFAFGMGIERIAMLKYGIPDLRSFYEADIRWLGYYGFPSYKGLMGGIRE
jgi:phenylalanyl-tRNA synthetase alpha chain